MSEARDDVPLPEGWTPDVEKLQAHKRRIEAEYARNPPPPEFEDEVLGLLREIRDLLRDRLPPRSERADG